MSRRLRMRRMRRGAAGSRGAVLVLPGTTGNYASTPDSAALDITGDIDLRAWAALNDWSAASGQALIGKHGGGQRSYLLQVQPNGALRLFLSPDGSLANQAFAESSASTGFADGTTHWIRATWRNSDGRVQFFTSANGRTWTQLGTDQSIVIAGIHSGTMQLGVGAFDADGSGNPAAGKILRAQVYDGIDGTLVFDADFTRQRVGATSFAEDANGATVTVNQSGSPAARIRSR